MAKAHPVAEAIADSLPIMGYNPDSDLISLCDLVSTALEHSEFTHFWVAKYDPDAEGSGTRPWAVLRRLPSAGKGPKPLIVTVEVMRQAVVDYLTSRLNGGMTMEEARRLVDGSYTDVVVADSIMQFALYGEEVFN